MLRGGKFTCCALFETWFQFFSGGAQSVNRFFCKFFRRCHRARNPDGAAGERAAVFLHGLCRNFTAVFGACFFARHCRRRVSLPSRALAAPPFCGSRRRRTVRGIAPFAGRIFCCARDCAAVPVSIWRILNPNRFAPERLCPEIFAGGGFCARPVRNSGPFATFYPPDFPKIICSSRTPLRSRRLS